MFSIERAGEGKCEHPVRTILVVDAPEGRKLRLRANSSFYSKQGRAFQYIQISKGVESFSDLKGQSIGEEERKGLRTMGYIKD